jgi:hypothetical protein
MAACRSLALALAVAVGLLGSPARSGELPEISYLEPAPGSGIAIASVGIFDFVSSDENSTTAMAQAEVTLDYDLLRVGDLLSAHPYFGAFVTLDASAMAFGGFQVLVPLGTTIEARPFFGLGAYHEGDGKDLGSLVLFHAGLTLFYKFSDDHRLGLSYSHQSHGGIFSSDNNHGANNVLLSYAVPLDRLF